jgi:hypothetical protein
VRLIHSRVEHRNDLSASRVAGRPHVCSLNQRGAFSQGGRVEIFRSLLVLGGLEQTILHDVGYMRGALSCLERLRR